MSFLYFKNKENLTEKDKELLKKLYEAMELRKQQISKVLSRLQN